MASMVRDGLWTWAKICKKKNYLKLVPLFILLGHMEKEER